MKNIFSILIIALLVVSCTSDNNFVVNGTVPESYNDQWVYLFDPDKRENIDSVLIVDSKFTFSGQESSINYLRVNLDREHSTSFITEKGEISIDMTAQPIAVSGTPLNDLLSAYSKSYNEMNESMYSEYMKISEEFKEDENTFSEKRKELEKEFKEKETALHQKYFATNENNALGKFVFSNWVNSLSGDEKDELISKLGENIKATPAISMIIARHENLKSTQEGNMFKDFTLKNGNIDGTSVSFSDYVGKGKYVLVDFWASWCGPCIREFPTLKEVYEKHKGDQFEIVGVAVWDERDAILKGIEQHEIPWPVIIDGGKSNRENTDLYGISGIPQIILFAPDGTIVARNLRGDALKEKVAEVLTNS